MKYKKLLTAILLGVVLCFVSGVGYGEVKIPGEVTVIGDLVTGATDEKLWPYIETLREDIGFLKLSNNLLNATVRYIMRNPTNFLNVMFYYDPTGADSDEFPKSIDTKGKIYVMIFDNRDHFSYKSGIGLLDSFKKELELIWSFVKGTATDMNTDIVATLDSGQGIPLAYFYQGEYHLWED